MSNEFEFEWIAMNFWLQTIYFQVYFLTMNASASGEKKIIQSNGCAAIADTIQTAKRTYWCFFHFIVDCFDAKKQKNLHALLWHSDNSNVLSFGVADTIATANCMNRLIIDVSYCAIADNFISMQFRTRKKKRNTFNHYLCSTISSAPFLLPIVFLFSSTFCFFIELNYELRFFIHITLHRIDGLGLCESRWKRVQIEINRKIMALWKL